MNFRTFIIIILFFLKYSFLQGQYSSQQVNDLIEEIRSYKSDFFAMVDNGILEQFEESRCLLTHDDYLKMRNENEFYIKYVGYRYSYRKQMEEWGRQRFLGDKWIAWELIMDGLMYSFHHKRGMTESLRVNPKLKLYLVKFTDEDIRAIIDFNISSVSIYLIAESILYNPKINCTKKIDSLKSIILGKLVTSKHIIGITSGCTVALGPADFILYEYYLKEQYICEMSETEWKSFYKKHNLNTSRE